MTQAEIAHARTISEFRTFAGLNRKANRNHDPTVSWTSIGLYGTDLWDDRTFAWMTKEDTIIPWGIIIGNDAAAGSWGREVTGYLDSRIDSFDVNNPTLMLNGGFFGVKIARVVALDVDTSITGTDTGTGQNYGAIAAATGSKDNSIAVLRVTAETSLTSMTVQLNESQDDGSADAYAQTTGWTITTGGNASAGTNEVDFTGTGWAVLTGSAAREAYIQTEVTAFTGTSATLQATYGEIAT